MKFPFIAIFSFVVKFPQVCRDSWYDNSVVNLNKAGYLAELQKTTLMSEAYFKVASHVRNTLSTYWASSFYMVGIGRG